MSNIHLTETDLTEQENAEVRSLLTGETEAVRKNVFTQIVARRIEQKLQRAPEATP